MAKERGITDKSPLADKIKALKGLKVSGAGPPMVLALEQRRIDAFATGTPIPDAAVARGFGLMVIHNAGGEDPDFGEFDERADHGLHAQDRRAEEPHPLRQARDERVLAEIRMRRG